MKLLHDPYRAILHRFNQRGIRYVVVGMAGINYYATSPADTFATLDYDVLLDPTISNVERALHSLRVLGFTIGTSKGALRPSDLRMMVRQRRTLVATTPNGLMIDLLLRVSGYTFAELAEDAVTVSVRGVPIRVGKLHKLLRSKQVAGREKDRQFLARYAALLCSAESPSSKKIPRSSRRRQAHPRSAPRSASHDR